LEIVCSITETNCEAHECVAEVVLVPIGCMITKIGALINNVDRVVSVDTNETSVPDPYRSETIVDGMDTEKHSFAIRLELD
jgi:hypothetical protein